MATLTVLKFDTPYGGEQLVDLIQDLQRQNLIKLQDAAIVSWPEGAPKPTTRHLASLTGLGALDGAFWGMLFGLLFFVPFLGMAVGAAMGALAGHYADYGIGREFIEEVRSKVTPGTSAAFLLTSEAVTDRVIDAVKVRFPSIELIASNLSRDQEEKLRTEFGKAA